VADAGRGEEPVDPRADDRGQRQADVRRFAGDGGTVDHDLVRRDASDGFILVPHLTPGGLDVFADTVVPLLQEWGVYRTEYTGATLREHLDL
jgi:alkanesulfonate monooxygenase SsuD/methylene tetrahydromethanopterin reductase-like flavin-dependent oxidoreductase (luciferase family)